jgi:ribosomal protein S18 acetylase RimI-like enzyme
MALKHYRHGTREDIEAISTLSLLAYGRFKPVISEENWQSWSKSMSDMKTFENLFDVGTCFVCESDKEIVGVAFVIPSGNPYQFFQSSWAYIRLVGVHPKFAGHGVGRELTGLCIKHARESDEETIALHTSAFQDAARHIYESLGFERQHEFVVYEKTYWIYTLNLATLRRIN